MTKNFMVGCSLYKITKLESRTFSHRSVNTCEKCTNSHPSYDMAIWLYSLMKLLWSRIGSAREKAELRRGAESDIFKCGPGGLAC